MEKWSFSDLGLQKEGGLYGNFYPWDFFPFSVSLNFFIFNPIFWQIPEGRALIPSFGNSTSHFWRKIICLSDLSYISSLDQFSLSPYSSQSFPIAKRKIITVHCLVSSPKKWLYLSKGWCVCVWSSYFLETIKIYKGQHFSSITKYLSMLLSEQYPLALPC